MENTTKVHIPVLLPETLDLLQIKPFSLLLDCTLGLGGHSYEILTRFPNVKIIGIDQDEENLSFAQNRLKEFGSRISFHHSNFSQLKSVIRSEGLETVDGILMDLGLSSPHVEIAERGFSFLRDGPLDMRFDRRGKLTAREIVNTYPAEKLQKLFSDYGQETEAKTVALAIVKARMTTPIDTTLQLTGIVDQAKRFKKFGKTSATNVFQALRIAVNSEFEVLEKALEDGVNLLSKGGRIVVISYHSLEDGIVKRFFKKYEAKGKKDISLQKLKLITKKPMTPSEKEISENIRSRSAKLRVAEKV